MGMIVQRSTKKKKTDIEKHTIALAAIAASQALPPASKTRMAA
jgi:hypothetical protein